MPKSRVKPKAQRRRQPEAPARREEVLETALALVAEHGVAGASLRRLASELGMSQPSLYHYFPSKDELIREIVEYCAGQMLSKGLAVKPPSSVEELPRYMKDAVLALYEGETHPRFIRFLFVVAIETKQNRALVERIFSERFGESFAQVAGWFASGAEEREDLEKLLRMVVYAVGFALLEERAIFGKRQISAKTARYADWVAESAERLLAMRPRSSSP